MDKPTAHWCCLGEVERKAGAQGIGAREWGGGGGVVDAQVVQAQVNIKYAL